MASLCRCILLTKKSSVDEDMDKENCDVLSNVERLLASVIERMIKSEPEDFELVCVCFVSSTDRFYINCKVRLVYAWHLCS